MPNDYYDHLNIDGDIRPLRDPDAQEKLFNDKFKFVSVKLCQSMFDPSLDPNNNLLIMPESSEIGLFDWESTAAVIIITFDNTMSVNNNKGNKIGFLDNNERFIYPIYINQNQSSAGYIYAGGTFLLIWHRTGTLSSGKPDGYFLIGDIQDAFGVKYDNANSGLTADNVNDAIDELDLIKANSAGLATVATSGDYRDLSNQPDISGKMDKANPTGSGALSINRAANSTVGANSVAVGDACEASGGASFAEGNSTEASGDYSHAEGGGTQAAGNYSHAEGADSSVFTGASCAHVEGYINTTSGSYSHVEGYSNHCSTDCQHVFGKNSIEDVAGDFVEVVGNGSSGTARSNARTLKWNGDETIAGDFFFNGNNTSLSNQLSAKQGTLTAGSNISIAADNTISATDTKPTDYNGQTTASGTAVAHGTTWQTLLSANITAGTWLVSWAATFASSGGTNTGYRGAGVATTGDPFAYMAAQVPAVTNNTYTLVSGCALHVATGNQTLNLKVRQYSTSGTSLTVTPRLQVIKIL